jgi:hypothetical protein
MLIKRSLEREPPPAYSGPQGGLDFRTSVAEYPAEEDARVGRTLNRGARQAELWRINER